ncbi:adenosine kinase [Maribellus mangrovi]|uniref:adenosine kinase n=1 Tax=Maribellus mangrovi TaxID=3133146 RepID=UPI0030EEF48B
MTTKNISTVLGVGNALIDVISVLESDILLENFGLPRGSMTLVDAGRSKQIYEATYSDKSELTTGGSVANTMRSMASLGCRGGYMGKVGKDELGELFRNDFEKRGLTAHLHYSDTVDTGRVMGLVSQDSERTMATYLGAAAEMIPEEFQSEVLANYNYLYVEGYLVFNHELITAGVELAKKNGLKVALDLSSFNVVEANLEFLKDIVKNHVDIVFANEEEAKSFTGLEPKEALHEIAKDCELAVVKLGKEGSLIKYNGEVTRVGSISAKALDTTGAGDAYAAGFFYGLTNGYNMETCGKIAALISGKVVEVMGPNLPDAIWDEVKAEIEKIVGE